MGNDGVNPVAWNYSCAQLTQKAVYKPEVALKGYAGAATQYSEVLNSRGIQALAQLITHPVCSLRRLNISKNKLNGEWWMSSRGHFRGTLPIHYSVGGEMQFALPVTATVGARSCWRCSYPRMTPQSGPLHSPFAPSLSPSLEDVLCTVCIAPWWWQASW